MCGDFSSATTSPLRLPTIRDEYQTSGTTLTTSTPGPRERPGSIRVQFYTSIYCIYSLIQSIIFAFFISLSDPPPLPSLDITRNSALGSLSGLSSPSSPLRHTCLHCCYREETSVLSSLVDSHRIAPTRAAGALRSCGCFLLISFFASKRERKSPTHVGF